MIPCWFAVRYIRPPRVPLPATALIHALLAIPVSLGHIALMVAFRTALWWMMGIDYHFNAPDGSPILYEFRKDLSAYVEIVFILFLVQWLVPRCAAPPPASSDRRAAATRAGLVPHPLPTH